MKIGVENKLLKKAVTSLYVEQDVLQRYNINLVKGLKDRKSLLGT